MKDIFQKINQTEDEIVFERIIDASIENVWNALTKADEMKKWYFNIEDFKLNVGHKFQFYGTNKGKQFLHLCKVTEIIEFKKIAYSWRYDGYGGESLVIFDLSEDSSKTTLRFTQKGIKTFSKDLPEFTSEKFAEGWKVLIDEELPKFLIK